MSFVYVLIFANAFAGVLELKEYSTFESCQAAASASYKEYVRVLPKLRGVEAYWCIPKPA